MKIYNKDKEIYSASLKNHLGPIGIDAFFDDILTLFPRHEQIRKLNDNLLIVVGSGQDTILLDVEYDEI